MTPASQSERRDENFFSHLQAKIFDSCDMNAAAAPQHVDVAVCVGVNNLLLTHGDRWAGLF